MLISNSNGQRLLGGGSPGFGYPLNHHAIIFIVPAAVGRRPFVEIRIFFPTKLESYAHFNLAAGRSEPTHEITIRFFPGTFTSSVEVLSAEQFAELPPRTHAKDARLAIFRFKMKEGERAWIEGFGTDVVCESAEDQAILDNDALVYGVMSLREMFRQRDFVALVQGFAPKMPDMVNNQLQEYFTMGNG